MKILFMGTAAAEGVPALFCQCSHCRYAWEHGGKEIRGRCGAMIDGRLKIDFGPDSYAHMLKYHLDYLSMRALLITHGHEDHLTPTELGYRMEGFGHFPPDDVPLTVYGNEHVGELVKPFLNPHLAYSRIRPFETQEIDGYQVTALEAVHYIDPHSDQYPVELDGKTFYRTEEAMFYLIEKAGKSILYAHDTDEFTPNDMQFLAGRKIDLISMDCTNATWDSDYYGHMGINDNLRMRKKLLENGAADEHTIFVANHFSHNGLASYEEMQKRLPGFIVSYDGLEISI